MLKVNCEYSIREDIAFILDAERMNYSELAEKTKISRTTLDDIIRKGKTTDAVCEKFHSYIYEGGGQNRDDPDAGQPSGIQERKLQNRISFEFPQSCMDGQERTTQMVQSRPSFVIRHNWGISAPESSQNGKFTGRESPTEPDKTKAVSQIAYTGNGIIRTLTIESKKCIVHG